jgi:hypothetical protein
MIEKFNFPVQPSNPRGQFPREYMDNGDGTITDKVTGLVWEKEGASSLYYWDAQKRIENLNDQKLGGHGNWRIPTLEELCSLLDSTSNPKGYYTPSVFGNAQSPCWTSDIDELHRLAIFTKIRFSVDFSKGEISSFASEHSGRGGGGAPPERLYLKTVRTSMQPQMTAKAERLGPADSAKSGEDSRVALLPGETKSDVIQRKQETERRLREEEEKARRQTQTASVPTKPEQASAPAYGQEIGHDGVYIAYANGIVKDTKTGLEWLAGPDGGMAWNEAKTWVESLNVGGGGWRVPTLEELKGLYQYGKGSRNMTPLLETTGYYVWSSQQAGGDFVAFDFSTDFPLGFPPWYGRGYSLGSRAFAVRSRSSG